MLVREEPVRTYGRPPLSEAYLRGEVGFDVAAVHDDGVDRAQDIELVTSTSVAALDPTAPTVTLDAGGTSSHDQLLLTAGAGPRRPESPGSALAGIHSLRSLPSSDALPQRIQDAYRVVVVGAVWIGSEVAAPARQTGRAVAPIELARAALERALGAVFRELHADHGWHVPERVGEFARRHRADLAQAPAGPAVGGLCQQQRRQRLVLRTATPHLEYSGAEVLRGVLEGDAP